MFKSSLPGVKLRPPNGKSRMKYNNQRNNGLIRPIKIMLYACKPKCNQPGHYATQCPTTDRGKAPAVNSIMADVQTVTTRSKAQATQWQVQDEVQQPAKEWIDTANKNKVVRMQTEMRDVPSGAPQSSAPSTSSEDDQLWDALTSSRISLPLHKLLPLIPRFRDTLATLTANTHSAAPPVHLTEPGTGSTSHGFSELSRENHY